MVRERERRRRRDGSDAELEGRSVGDQICHVGTDPPLDITDRRRRVLVWRNVDLDRQVDIVDVDEALAQRPWHPPVQLDDDGPGGWDRRSRRLDRKAQGAGGGLVGRGGVEWARA